jgi:hypothetical protein
VFERAKSSDVQAKVASLLVIVEAGAEWCYRNIISQQEGRLLMTRYRSRWISLANGSVLVILSLAASTVAFAQTADLQLGTMYACPGDVTFKVFSCAGAGNADSCEVESSVRGQPPQRGKAPRQQVMVLLPVCHLQTPAEARAATSGGGTPANSQADANGFKIGDEVSAATAGGWYVARILQANGDRYLVRFNAATEVWKTYPTEMRRIGPLNDVDRARGLFALHDKVQVNVEGKWVQGEIISEFGLEYQVQLLNNRSVWATAQHMQRIAVAEKPLPKAGAPPKPGLKSCAGRIEGRYASSTGGAGQAFQLTFRSGKALMRELSGEEEYECWIEGDKIYLHKAGESADMDMPIDINNDGTLETPFGEIKKKGN